jgi:hypothetical protein
MFEAETQTSDNTQYFHQVVEIPRRSINGLPKEEGTLYIMPERLPYISLIDENAQVK